MPRDTKLPSTTPKKKPYAKKPSSDDEGDSPAKGTPTKSPGKQTGGYDKSLLTQIVFEFATKDFSWDGIAVDLGKSTSQCRDIWRKILLPNLLSGKSWSSSSGGAWNSEDKIKLVKQILANPSGQPDWQNVAARLGGDKTVTQVKDYWRKIIRPKLERGDILA